MTTCVISSIYRHLAKKYVLVAIHRHLASLCDVLAILDYQTLTYTCSLLSKRAFFQLNHLQCGYGESVQSLARSAETITNTYTQLHTVLDSLHLNNITGKHQSTI